MSFKEECQHRWQNGTFCQHGKIVKVPEEDGKWVPYEEYMEARLLEIDQSKVARLAIRFPADAAESNQLHIHPESDRRITVIQGTGKFVAKRNGMLLHLSLAKGTRIWMPRGILHTFFAGSHGMLVESLHNPWIPLEDEQCLIYPEL